MLDETIAPTLYRTGRGDRSIPLFLGILLPCAGPILAWLSGPYLWPWGALMGTLALIAGAAALRRWQTAGNTVLWDEAAAAIEFRSGRRRARVSWHELTKIQVRPASVRTWLWAGKKRFSLSHRLVRAESLLQRLRLRRPDLFPDSSSSITLRRSSASAVLQLALALGTGGAGALLASWQPGVGLFFGVASLYVFVRILFFIPRFYEITPGAVRTRYWLRVRRYGSPQAIREQGYAADGAVFFRMILDYGSWKVVLDEGQLVDHLRSRADGIVHLLRPRLIG